MKADERKTLSSRSATSDRASSSGPRLGSRGSGARANQIRSLALVCPPFEASLVALELLFAPGSPSWLLLKPSCDSRGREMSRLAPRS